MLKGIFLNTAKANCSIHESGKMSYDALKLSSKYSLDYLEIDRKNNFIPLKYDFYIFNYHPLTMGWLDTAFVKNIPGFKATIVLEVSPNDPFILCPKDHFDAYLALDPTIDVPDKNVFAFPRPLEEIAASNVKPLDYDGIVIGTFGISTPGKGYVELINAVNEEFDEAMIRMNIVKGDYVGQEFFDNSINEILEVKKKPGVKLELTHHFFSKEDLVAFCSQNSLNAFLYTRDRPGLSATTDQAIIALKPLAVSDNNTFRHITKYLKPYPHRSLKQAIETSFTEVKQMRLDWAPIKFSEKFEMVLREMKVESINALNKPLKLKSLSTLKANLSEAINYILKVITFGKLKLQQRRLVWITNNG